MARKASVWVKTLQGDATKWDTWNEIRRCNPLVAVDANFRKKLLSERDAARRDPRLRARFQSYRLNIPSGDESAMLLNADDLERILKRPVPEREGRASGWRRHGGKSGVVRGGRDGIPMAAVRSIRHRTGHTGHTGAGNPR